MAGTNGSGGEGGKRTTAAPSAAVPARRGHRPRDTYYAEQLAQGLDGEWLEFPELRGRTHASMLTKKLREGWWALPEGTTPEQWEFLAVGSKIHNTSRLYARFVGGKRG